MKIYIASIMVWISGLISAQQQFKITGTVIEEGNKQPLEYATVTLESTGAKKEIFGGVTDSKGHFSVEAPEGNYVLKIQFFSFKTYQNSKFVLKENKNIGTIALHDDVAQLEGTEVVGKKSTVEMRLDKKIYNVGDDMVVKGGSVSDVLDNVPSVAVDSEGKISLRGSESVNVLINGKPSAMLGMSGETLKNLPSEMIEKVEVITNPSARYDAEGTAGIINIVLKRGKGLGLTGSVGASVGVADTELASGTINLNLRRNKFTLFNTTSYRYQNITSTQRFEQQAFAGGIVNSYQNEYRDNIHLQKGLNTNFGVEYRPTDKISITNTLFYGNQNGGRDNDVMIYNYDASKALVSERNRFSDETEKDNRWQYAFNYDHNFNDNGHRLTAEYQYSFRDDNEYTFITDRGFGEKTTEVGKDNNHTVKLDYVLPLGKDTQFEAGYQGSFKDENIDYQVFNENSGSYIFNTNYSNNFFYNEKIQSLYTQLGSKFGNFNIMAGLRMENTNIDIRETNSVGNKKEYTSLFPSLFLGYAFTEENQLSISYSRRLQRPRGRFINPFTSRSSNTNLFRGNSDLDPTYTDAYDLGYLVRFNKITLNSSLYYNHSKDVFAFIARESGELVTIGGLNVPVMITSPANLAQSDRFGAEFTATYAPKNNLRFTWSVNFFNEKVQGDYSYTNYLGTIITRDFGVENTSWFSRFSAKTTLPWNIDFQATGQYNAPRKTAQSRIKGEFFADLSLSKEVLNKKGTLSLNVRDLLNSRRMRSNTQTLNVHSNTEMQFRPREIVLSFSYRFGSVNNDKKRTNKSQRNNASPDMGGEEMMF